MRIQVAFLVVASLLLPPAHLPAVDDVSLQTGLPCPSTLYSAHETLRAFDAALPEVRSWFGLRAAAGASCSPLSKQKLCSHMCT